jgi:hypothetical protein
MPSHYLIFLITLIPVSTYLIEFLRPGTSYAIAGRRAQSITFNHN